MKCRMWKTLNKFYRKRFMFAKYDIVNWECNLPFKDDLKVPTVVSRRLQSRALIISNVIQ